MYAGCNIETGTEPRNGPERPKLEDSLEEQS